MSSPSDAGSPRAGSDEDAVDALIQDWIRRRVRRHQSWRADRGERMWRSVLAWVLSLLLHLLLVLGILLAPVDMPSPPPPDHDAVLQVELLPPPPPGGKAVGSAGSGSASSRHSGQTGPHHVVTRGLAASGRRALRQATAIAPRLHPRSVAAGARVPAAASPPVQSSMAPLPVVVTDHQPHPPAAVPPLVVPAPISLQPLVAAQQVRPSRPPRAEGNQPMPVPQPPSAAPVVAAPEQARLSMPRARLASPSISAPRLMAAARPPASSLADIPAIDTVALPTVPASPVATAPSSSPVNAPALTVAAASTQVASASELPAMPETAAPWQSTPAEALAKAAATASVRMETPVTPPSMPPVSVAPADLPELPSDTAAVPSMAAPETASVKVEKTLTPSAPVAAMPAPITPAETATAPPDGEQAEERLAKDASAKDGAAADAASRPSREAAADALAGTGHETTAGRTVDAGQGLAPAGRATAGTGAANPSDPLGRGENGAAGAQAQGRPGGQVGGQAGGVAGGHVGAHGTTLPGAAAGGSSNTSPPGHYISLRAPANTDVGPSRSVTIEYHRTRFDKDWVADDENQLDSAMRHIGEKLRSHHKLHLPGGVSFHCDTGAQPDSGSRGLGSLLPFGCHGEAPPQASGKDGDRRLDLAPAHALDGSATAASVAGKPLPRPVVAPLDTTAMCETARMAGGPLPAGCNNREIRRPAPASSTSWAPPLDRF